MEQNLELKTKTVDYDETADKIVHKYTAGQFEGPLDLLWTLIRDNKINIYDIPIAEITEQFLEYLDYASQVELGDLSEFYNMAARLVYIRSRMKERLMMTLILTILVKNLLKNLLNTRNLRNFLILWKKKRTKVNGILNEKKFSVFCRSMMKICGSR